MFLLPDGIFKIETLRILRLSFCAFVLPEPKNNFVVTGLPCLRILSFSKMDLRDMTVLQALFKACSKLETVELLHCFFPMYFKIVAEHLKKFKACKPANVLEIVGVAIDAPNLTTLHYSGPLVVFIYKDFDKLTDCILDFKPHRAYLAMDHYKLDQVMYDMSNIEGLCPKHSDGNSTINDFFCLSRLKEIQLFMEGSRYCNVFTIVSFLRKCPSIEKIHIDCRGWFRADMVLSNGYALAVQQHSLLDWVVGPSYPNLKVLKLTGFKFEPHEMKLLSYFVETGLNLETVAIFLPSPRSKETVPFMDEETLNRRFRPKMASPIGRIRVFQHFEDQMFYPSKHPKNWYDR
ncbi:unnamed protein product [Linum tenue]|uniref:At1g61320/AtMIF1 LRR domain-containing protein n=1 Tax=Linum tenue TaxID=586396 RepID=A0AAV0JBK5_9ROSI|nr:unnamed protein product [Linum tenue]